MRLLVTALAVLAAAATSSAGAHAVGAAPLASLAGAGAATEAALAAASEAPARAPRTVDAESPDTSPLGLAVDMPGRDNGTVVVRVRTDGAIGPGLHALLRRGVPATVSFTAELWRARAAWFDRLERAQSFSYRIQYDLLQEVYRLRAPGGAEADLPDSAEIDRAFAAGVRVHLAREADLAAGQSYYIVVRAAAGPLSVQDVREMEDWMAGGARGDVGGILGVGGYVGTFLKTLVGLGGRHATARTAPFTVETLAHGAPSSPAAPPGAH